VNVPKLGPVPKKALIVIGVGAGGFVAYRYYRARTMPSPGPGEPGFEDPGILPGVAGAVPDDNRFGSGADTAPSVDDFGFHGTNNAQWSQYVTTQLSQSDQWPYDEITTALGNFLTGVPLSDRQQSIVRSAIALAGYPPVGQHVIVPGGNTAIMIAPSGVRATVTATTITISFNGVPGASRYNAYRSNITGTTQVPFGVANTSPIVLSGLEPGTSYSVQVAAVSASGAVGPKSTAITVKTAGVTMAKCAKPTVSAVTSSSAHIATKPIKFADTYLWYLNGHLVSTTNTPAWTTSRQHPRTRYSVRVRADSKTSAPGPLSDTTYYTTTK
jgi:hypothetical protein